MGDIQTVLSLAAAIALLIIWAIILWWVCPWIGMPPNPTQIVRALIVAIAIFYSLHDVIAVFGGSGYRASFNPPSPSIIAPERR
jgi:hypothetical protein